MEHSPTRRLVFGVLILVLVNILWVGSSELTRYLFSKDLDFNRPFFTTYSKTCMFMIYLIGFIFYKPWQDQCFSASHPMEEAVLLRDDRDSPIPTGDRSLSAPRYEPIQPCSSADESERTSLQSEEADLIDAVASGDSLAETHVVTSGSPSHQLSEDVFNAELTNALGCSDRADGDSSGESKRMSRSSSVRFSELQEVRHLPVAEATAARLSRLSFELWLRARRLYGSRGRQLPVRTVARLALQFSILWFVGNIAYQEALSFAKPGLVNVISATAAFYTLILAAVFPSNEHDRFTLSKFAIVLISVAGVALITFFDAERWQDGLLHGVIASSIGAVAYALYLVMLRRQADSEEKLDIPMFFGFVGLFSCCLLWPVFFVLDRAGVEPFYPLPNRTQILYIAINGLLGTVLSEYLWLWGCFLTSSLIATLSLSLMVPLTIIADMIIWKKVYPVTFLGGAALILSSFIACSIFEHYKNWDPLLELVCWSGRKCGNVCQWFRWCFLCKGCRGVKNAARLRKLDDEQSETLIS